MRDGGRRMLRGRAIGRRTRNPPPASLGLHRRRRSLGRRSKKTTTRARDCRSPSRKSVPDLVSTERPALGVARTAGCIAGCSLILG
jgi:hypothetical protein